MPRFTADRPTAMQKLRFCLLTDIIQRYHLVSRQMLESGEMDGVSKVCRVCIVGSSFELFYFLREKMMQRKGWSMKKVSRIPGI